MLSAAMMLLMVGVVVVAMAPMIAWASSSLLLLLLLALLSNASTCMVVVVLEPSNDSDNDNAGYLCKILRTADYDETIGCFMSLLLLTLEGAREDTATILWVGLP